jgi:hypothetical protein
MYEQRGKSKHADNRYIKVPPIAFLTRLNKEKRMKNLNKRTLTRLSTRLAYVRNNPLLVLSSIMLLSLAAIALPGARLKVTAAGQPQKGAAESQISEAAQLQIKALLDEKDSRTPAQQKIDSQLIYASRMYRGQSVAAGVPTLEVEVGLDSSGKTIVDITTIVDDKVLSALKSAGAEILYSSEVYQSIRAIIPIDRLETIAALQQVRFIQPKQEARTSQRMQRPTSLPDPATQAPGFDARAERVRAQVSEVMANAILPNGTLSVGSVASEGDTAHRASTARGTFNVNGTGIKIGVLSDGVTNLALAQASGDLGTVTVLPGQTGTGDEGTAMLEIVHDVAPGAQLFFATAFTSITSFAQNIRDLRTAGCDIIVDDVGYFVESAFQDGAPGVTNTNGGVVTQAVNDVVAAGALYFSSAANSGNKNDNTSTTWEGDFANGGTLAVVPGGGTVHDFDPSAAVAQVNIITVGGGTGVPINLSWSDPLGGSTNDYDLFILNNAGTAVSVSSTNVQSGTQDPYEQVNTNNTTGRRVVIRQKAGAANRFVHLSLNGGLITFNTQGETHGHNAASGCYGVAATPAFSAFNFPPPVNFGPYPNAYSGTNQVENFSSDGPRKFFFNGNGTAITPGDFSSTGGQTIQQPVITAADGVAATGVGDFPIPFFGTSAAAPHAAAIAGLIKSANPSFTQAQIKTALTTTAIDIETAGTDRDAGFGIVMPYPALQSLGVTGKAFLELGSATATESCCNSNGLIERGEGASLNIVLNNPGLLNATGITSTLSTSTPGVTILNGSSAYADLAATSGTGANTTAFSFSLATNSAVDLVINFTLTVNYTGGWNPSQVINFIVETGRKPITTVLDTTTPTISTSFPTSATGTQTNLVFPDDPPSTCAAPTAFPGTLTSTTPRFDSYTLTNTSGATACVTITITADKSALGAIQAVAYNGAFNPANVGTNYLADPGFSSIVFPGYPGVFSGNIPAAGTLTVVVVELKSPANGFPSAVGSTYTLKVAGLPVTSAPTLAKVGSFDATSFNDGRVLLKWNSTYEVDNLGYNVYREVGGQRTKVNPQLIAGSALITGDKVALSSGKGYAWGDQPQSTASARYWLEAVDLEGQSTWTGPVSVKALSANPTAMLEQSALLTRIGLAQSQMTLGQGSTPVETRAQLAAPTPATLQLQSGLAGQAAVKLPVRREGLYRIAQRDLLAAGLDSKADPRNFQLYVDGQAVAMIVNGEQDGRFDAADSIEFYGVGLDNAATDTHVYWLAAGAQPGTRIKAVRASGGTAAGASFPYTVERKDRTLYFSGLKNGEVENFFGPVVSGTAVDQSLTLTGVAAASTGASIDVALQGVTGFSHQVRVLLNGSNVGTVNFSGQGQGKASFPVAQSLLREGSNSVQLIALGGSSDISLVDTVRITYQRKYVADSNALRLSASGGQQVTIGGFNSSSIRVIDVTNSNNAQELTGAILGSKTSGSISLTVPGTGPRVLYAFGADRVSSVTPKANRPSNLLAGGQGADYVMITTQELSSSLNQLKVLRQSQGLEVAVVDVEDIYDEFSFGNKSPQAVKDFLALANSSWARRVRYVLLAGDASYDPKNYLGFGDSDLVPTKLYDSGYMEAATDDWFVDFDGNWVPDVAIGRLPVRNAAEAGVMVTKIIGYESSSGSNSALLVSDTNDGYGFSSVNSVLRDLLPAGTQVNEINRGSGSDSAIRSQILAAINAGQRIVNYNGHGSVNMWRGEILTSSDAGALTNNQKLAVFVMMTCLNGYFDDPALDSLSESVMKANAGAAGAWGSTAQCEPTGQANMNEELYRLLFNGSGLTVGEATAKAKEGVRDVDVRRSWIYFGDPAMKLK